MKPQDFLIGIRDFFAILVPGAVFLACLSVSNLPSEAFNIVALAIAAYLIGSVTDRIGSVLDEIIDPLIENPRVKRMSSLEAAASECRTRLLEDRATDLGPKVNVKELLSVRSFWWSHLRLSCPPAVHELDRIEGAQKLFRSLTAAFLIVALLYTLDPALIPDWLSERVGRPGAWMLFFAFLSSILYVVGRMTFRAAVFRFAIAYWVLESAQRAKGQDSSPSPTE